MRRYLQECHGDVLYTYQICAVYDRTKTYNISLFQSHIINESALSTGKVVAHLTFNERDNSFLVFRKEVDTVMPKAINNCYGNFYDYTAPIFNQGFLTILANCFKTTLGRQYEAISIMLNKHEKQVYQSRAKQNRCQWDRTVMYKFFSLMRVRNAHYFPCWALCNAA